MDDKSKVAVVAAVAKLLDRWRINESQKIAVLGLESEADLSSFFHSPSSVNLSPALEQRLSLILNIHEKLRLLFSNPENTYGFMTLVNNNTPFLGKRPIDLASQGADGLTVAHTTLLSMFGGTK
jgi:hypothetical protein